MDIETRPVWPAGTAQTLPSVRSLSSEVRRAIKIAWPVLIALVSMALVLGAQAAQRGLSVGEVTLMTALNFAGGSEFAALGVWTTPLPISLIVGMTFLINCRYLLMGAALAPYVRHLQRRTVFPALFLMVDESWALSLADARKRGEAGIEPPFSLPFYVTLGLMFWVPWFGFAALGAMFGPVVGNLGR